jgi:transcriptional/translational regulatory protein YebC/TACO1
MDAAIEGGADDVTLDGDTIEVVTEPSALSAVRQALEAAGIECEQVELTMIPKTTVTLDEADARKTLRLIDALESSDDVQEVYANFDISDEVLEAVAG